MEVDWMEIRRDDKKERPLEFPPLPLWAEGIIGSFDPLGSYTGRVQDPEDKPVQDADDL
jgi:hypothetical protein